jgi:hypothetical protein
MVTARPFRDVLAKAKHLCHSIEVLKRARKNPACFTRKRKLGFADLVCIIMGKINTSTQTALNRHFKEYHEQGQSMSQQAFSKARSHINHTPFERLFREEIKEQYASGKYEYPLWKGYHILAVDGSEIALPNTPELLKAFGSTGRKADCPSARVSILYDILNDMILDAGIGRSGTGERECALEHMKAYRRMCPKNRAGIICDRGVSRGGSDKKG